MLRIGAWIEHPVHGLGRIANHNGTRYIVSFPSIGLREVDSHDATIREVPAPLQEDPIKAAVRDVLEEYGFGGVAELAGRWEGGEIVVKPARDDVQPHRLPVDKLFNKVVMIRDRLRVLEQKINGNKTLSAMEKAELQAYITRCYGSLTSFNFLFKRDDEKFSSS